MTYSEYIREEELKNRVAQDFFNHYDSTRILGNVDFAISVPTEDNQLFETEYLLWAEAKKGNKSNIEYSFVQLIITIGKARTFEKHLPPRFLGAFDASRIAFIPYNDLLEIFYQNDFNWNVTPSDHTTKEFIQVYEKVKDILQHNTLIFNYVNDKKELQRFIKTNFIVGKPTVSKIRISKNNFVTIYQKWLKEVKPTIQVNWETAKKNGIIDADFYLADILSEHNVSLREKLFVLLRDTYYELDRQYDEMGFFKSSKATFIDDQNAHILFWNRYNRPPKREYWDYIVERRDLLVPPDVRERKGSYFTPQKWVELSQKYLADELGIDWQDEYYIWDCAAGTGNLLNGLTNKYHIWASTLDKADVDVMHERIKNGANLLEEHVFQFDFLNDSFDKLPTKLKEIIENEEKRRRLVIYINPPYAEAANKQTVSNTGKNKTAVAVNTSIYDRYKSQLGIAGRELFAQFMMRVYREIPSSVLASFSTLKNLQAPNFRDFRANFRAKLGKIFMVPADTFDNVSGKFPISFQIWHLNHESPIFTKISADVYDAHGADIGTKTLFSNDGLKTINDWIITTRNNHYTPIGFMSAKGCDFQNVNYLFIINNKEQLPHPRGTVITLLNIREISVYFAVRKSISPSWLNDRDQYLYPHESWKDDIEFQNDCLAYTLFDNNISSKDGINHWIPYTEEEVGARDCFTSHTLSAYIAGRNDVSLFSDYDTENKALEFSDEATALLDAGRELWRYYHSHHDSNPDASLYDIKLYFQGYRTSLNGKTIMNSGSKDEQYCLLIQELKERLRILAAKIEPKVYFHGFLNQ